MRYWSLHSYNCGTPQAQGCVPSSASTVPGSGQRRSGFVNAVPVVVKDIRNLKHSERAPTPAMKFSHCVTKSVLPLLVLMVASTLLSTGTAYPDEDGMPLRGRFSSTPFGQHIGRKLLNINFCVDVIRPRGSFPDYDCDRKLRFAKTPRCCVTNLNNRLCFDVSNLEDRCGSCTNKCRFGEKCCDGVCANLLTNNRHCGGCDKRCSNNQPCRFGMCGYGSQGHTKPPKHDWATPHIRLFPWLLAPSLFLSLVIDLS